MANASALKRVLLVDDDEGIRMLCEDALVAAGHRVCTASNGAEALAQLEEGYDLVVTDMNMPVVGGLELYRRAVQRHPHLKKRFVFMTGRDCVETRATLDNKDIICLRKPFAVNELIDTVDEATRLENEGFNAPGKRVKRDELRFSLAVECTVSVDAPGNAIGVRTFPAIVEDLSRNGVRIRYAGEPLKLGDGLKISFKAERMAALWSAKAAWSKRSGGAGSITGVRLAEPVPVFWILSALPAHIRRVQNF